MSFVGSTVNDFDIEAPADAFDRENTVLCVRLATVAVVAGVGRVKVIGVLLEAFKVLEAAECVPVNSADSVELQVRLCSLGVEEGVMEIDSL